MWLLLIPVASVLVAVVVLAARSRPARTRDAMLTIEGYRRMITALTPAAEVGADASPAADPVRRHPADEAAAPAGAQPAPRAGAIVPPAREIDEAPGDAAPERSVRT
jgi:hypothetical protein